MPAEAKGVGHGGLYPDRLSTFGHIVAGHTRVGGVRSHGWRRDAVLHGQHGDRSLVYEALRDARALIWPPRQGYRLALCPKTFLITLVSARSLRTVAVP